MQKRKTILHNAENRRLNIHEYRAGSTVLNSRPRYIMIELTRGCNLSCKMCRKESVPFVGNTMSSSLFQKISRDFFPKAELIDLRGWGESLLLPGFGDYLETAAQQSSANLRIVTNLSFQCDDVLKLLADANCYVGVSIDSANPDTLAEIRSGANLHLIEENLTKTVNYYVEKWGTPSRISICCTLQRKGLQRIESMADLAKKCGVKIIMLSAVTSELPADYCLTGMNDNITKELAVLAYRAKINGISVYATSQIGKMPLKQNAPACVRPWSFATISCFGQVGFCDHLIGPLTDEFSMGDYNTTDFDDIWNGQEWQELRCEHHRRQCFSMRCSRKCSECYQKRYVDFEHLLFPEESQRRMMISQ